MQLTAMQVQNFKFDLTDTAKSFIVIKLDSPNTHNCEHPIPQIWN